ncbi:MAG: hypothetical protein QNJ61_06075 [Desulfobacterales bacterium]|nr:hypothetical protein [Desulfobacterales bacterium]
MTLADLDPTSRQFLETLYAQTGADTAIQISMYDLGASMGLDRDQSTFTAEDLMAEGIIEIRTLSGNVGLSENGKALFQDEDGKDADRPDNRLGHGSPIDERQRALVDKLLAALKVEIGEPSLSYEALAEIVADLRTVDAQMASPRPKTMIIRVCLESVRDGAAAQSVPRWRTLLDKLLA